MENVFTSKTFKIIIGAMLAGAFTLFVFSAGVAIGFHRAEFTGRWYEGYRQNFMGPMPGKRAPVVPVGVNPMSSHSVSGNILSVDDDSIIIKTADGETMVSFGDKTAIREKTDDVKATDLKVGDRVIVIGSPNAQGQIQAALIRVVDQNF